MNRNRLLLGLLLAVAGTFAGACGNPPVYIDRGLAQGVPCQPPCWEGLVPGVATDEQVRRTLQRLQQSGQIPPYDEASGPRRTMYRVGESWEGSIQIWTEDGELALIEGKVGFDLNLEQLIDRIGVPQAAIPAQLGVETTCACAVQHTGVTPDHWYANATSILFYPEKGMGFTIAIPPEDVGCICPYMKVIGFDYTPPMPSAQEQWQYCLSFYLGSMTIQESDLTPWHGFGPGYLQVENP